MRTEISESANQHPADVFENLVMQYYEPLYKFALSLTKAEADARDLTQHTFCVWANKGHQLRDIRKAKSWLFTTLHRAFLEDRRKQSRFEHFEFHDEENDWPVALEEPIVAVDSPLLLQALARVDQVHRAAVALFYLEDYSYKEIAEILEVPVGTIKSRMARGVAQLRRILSRSSCQYDGFDRRHSLEERPICSF